MREVANGVLTRRGLLAGAAGLGKAAVLGGRAAREGARATAVKRKKQVTSAFRDTGMNWDRFSGDTRGIAAAAVLAFILSWNEFVFALTLASGRAKTVSVAMLDFIEFQSVALGPLMAAGTLAVAPIAVVLFTTRRQLVTGMSFGAVNG